MAALKRERLHILFLVVSLFVSLIIFRINIKADHTTTTAAVEQLVVGSEAFRLELDKLTSKLHSLESLVDKIYQELKSKYEAVALKENTILEKSESSSKDQCYAESHLKDHEKPAFESLKQKALEKKAQAEKWAEPHVQAIKSKWIPAAREQWVSTVSNVEPQLQSLTRKTKEVYIQSKDVLAPHLNKIKKVVDPHAQTVKEVSKTYIDPIATATKPHLDKARETVAPYTNEAVIAYGKLLEAATKRWKVIPTLVRGK